MGKNSNTSSAASNVDEVQYAGPESKIVYQHEVQSEHGTRPQQHRGWEREEDKQEKGPRERPKSQEFMSEMAGLSGNAKPTS